MRAYEHVRALYEGGKTASASFSGLLRVKTVTEGSGENWVEYHAVVTNQSDCPVFLEKVELLRSADPASFGLGEGPWLIFRSGRHKNDLPGFFETGCADARLSDVAAVMAESGDGLSDGAGYREVVSDHLSLIRGTGKKSLAISFLTGRDQLFQTRFLLDEAANLNSVIAETLFGIQLDPGISVRSETIRLALTEEPEEEIEYFAERKARLYGRRNSRRPAVFCTWYYYGLSVTYEDVKRNLQMIQDRQLPYDVFQVDEGWEITLGEYEPNDKFPCSMQELAQEIRSAGLTPGLWSSPFVAHETASVWKTHPEWILRDSAGAPCLFPMNDTVYLVFDLTAPGVCDYFRELYHRFTFEWGYTYHKLDFTRASVIFDNAFYADRRVPLARAYYQAVRAIREGMGEDAFLLMCGGLYDPIIGLADAQRTGSDVLSMWASSINRDGKTAPYTIRQSMMRYYMNRWWANDPDALMIRRNPVMERGLRLTYGLLNDEEVKTSVINQFAGGGIMCQTEPLDRIDEDRLLQLRHILPVLPSRTRPLGFFSGARFPGAMDVFFPENGSHCICLINWSDSCEQRTQLNLSELPLDPDASYAVCDFYSGEYRLGVAATASVEFAPLQPHGATVLKVEKITAKPIIVASDGHYSMGVECRRLEWTSQGLVIELPEKIPAQPHYLVWIPEINQTVSWP